MAFTVNKKAFCVLEFAKTESIVTVQRRFRIMHHTEPLTDKTIREWYMNSSRVAACALRNEQAVRAYIHWVLVSFPRLKRPGHDVDHPPATRAEVKNEWKCNYTPSVCLRGMERETFTSL